MRAWIKYKFRNNFLVEKKVEEIHKLHQMNYEQLKEYKDVCFTAMIKRTVSQSVFYKKLYADYGIGISDIKNIEDVSRLPIINKDVVRANTSDILTVPKALTVKGYTSGTSGSPLTVYRSYDSILIEQAYQAYFRYIHGINQGDRLVSLRGNLDKTKIYKYDRFENILYLSSYNINAKTVNQYIKLIREFKPKGILGYPSSLENLCNELQKLGEYCHIPTAITSSETLYDFQRVKIREFIGATVFDWYGNAERTVAIGQYPDGSYYEAPGYAVLESYDEGLLTTSLINSAFPLIRYHISDKVAFCNDQKLQSMRKISSISGRSDDIVVLSDGTRIGRLDIAFKGITNLLYAQIHQHTVGAIMVYIVPQFSPFDSSILKMNLRKLLGESVSISIREVNEADIEKTAKGKYKLVVNKVANQ